MNLIQKSNIWFSRYFVAGLIISVIVYFMIQTPDTAFGQMILRTYSMVGIVLIFCSNVCYCFKQIPVRLKSIQFIFSILTFITIFSILSYFGSYLFQGYGTDTSDKTMKVANILALTFLSIWYISQKIHFIWLKKQISF